MRNAFIDTIIAACRERDDIFILSGDAGLGVFDTFKEEYPHRFRNMGVAEQNTISFAAGLAMTGFKVFIYNIAPFVLYRCYEQVRNDLCYQELPVVLVGTGSGITYAPMGMSHYAVEDLGIVQTLPNLVAISPMDPVEARVAAQWALTSDKPLYVRLAKRGEATFHGDEAFDIRLPQIIRAGADSAIVFHGSIADEVMSAYDALRLRGRTPLLVSIPTVQPLAGAALLNILAGVRQVVCVEEHFAHCGLGGMLARLKAEQPVPWGLTLLGIPPHFIHSVAQRDTLRSLYAIAATDIMHAVEAAAV